MDTPRAPGPLDFETVVPALSEMGGDGGAQPPGGVACASCARQLTDEYYEANGTPVCQACSESVADMTQPQRGTAVLLRAGAYGIAAAILGAILYYAVIAITNFEIGLVAIAIGYMVGYAVRRGASGRGGRRLQVIALVLTYWAVGLAYTPMLFKAMSEQAATAAVEGGAAPDRQAEVPAPVEAAAAPGLATALGILLALTFALPVLSVVNSLPGGLLSAAIIYFGMHQAWRMTAAPEVQISGPYRIGGVPAGSA